MKAPSHLTLLFLLIVGVLLVLPQSSHAQTETENIATSMAQGILAFPGAEGFGRFTTGGRGGDVYKVTNLNDSGVGSLRYAVEQSGTRTVIFEVSGSIELQKDLEIENDHITIFGQTAPGGGIAIKGYSVVIQADNVIIQHIRFRPGDIKENQSDALWGRDQKDIIIDHCSMSWSIDEAASFYDNVNFTLQWSMLYESLYNSEHDKGAHGYGGIWGGQGATFHHNLLAHHSNRNPRFNGSRYSGHPDLELVDYRNNVIYNWGDNSAYGGERGRQNMVANYYKPGPATPDGEKKYRILDAKPPSGNYEELGKWHISKNYVVGSPDVTADNIGKGVHRVSQVHKDSILYDEPFPAPGLPSFESAEAAYLNVLANVGAVLPERDTLDRRIAFEVSNGTATYGGVFGKGLGIIDSQNEVGGWPELTLKEAPMDSDNDGIPDVWEDANELNPNDPTDGKSITDSGYSNLELYIHSLSVDSHSEPFPGESGLIYPVNETGVSGYPEFKWQSALYASKYQFQLRESSGKQIIDTLVADTMFIMTEALESLKSKTNYSWRVRARNSSGIGGWSSYKYFVTGVITSISEDDVHPKNIELSQNYPNPFNPATNIEFQLSETAHVQLNVFDITGRKISQLISEIRSPGIYQQLFDASSLGSSIYFYELVIQKAGGTTKRLTRQMTVIK